jgi:hypothetical protein
MFHQSAGTRERRLYSTEHFKSARCFRIAINNTCRSCCLSVNTRRPFAVLASTTHDITHFTSEFRLSCPSDVRARICSNINRPFRHMQSPSEHRKSLFATRHSSLIRNGGALLLVLPSPESPLPLCPRLVLVLLSCLPALLLHPMLESIVLVPGRCLLVVAGPACPSVLLSRSA